MPNPFEIIDIPEDVDPTEIKNVEQVDKCVRPDDPYTWKTGDIGKDKFNSYYCWNGEQWKYSSSKVGWRSLIHRGFKLSDNKTGYKHKNWKHIYIGINDDKYIVWTGKEGDVIYLLTTLDSVRQIEDLYSLIEKRPEKPPVGVKPSFVWIKERIEDLESAIERYKKAGFNVPEKWTNELYCLKENLKDIHVEK